MIVFRLREECVLSSTPPVDGPYYAANSSIAHVLAGRIAAAVPLSDPLRASRDITPVCSLS